MTVAINIASSNGLDLRWATLYGLFANSPVQDGGTSTEFTLLNTGAFNGEDADIRFIIEGTGFTYTGTFPDIEVTGGTITAVSMQTEAGVTLATFTGLAVSAAAFDAAMDTYIGGGPGSPDPSALDAIFRSEHYEVIGGAGKDIVEGGDLADVLDGGAGADVFIGGAGNDTFVGGGAEGDTVDYSTDALHGGTQGVIVNQHGGISQGGLPPDTAIDGFGDTDSIVNVRNVTGTQFDDQVYGGTHSNRIDGGAGSDFIFGHDGGDILIGGAGGDTLDGGNGNQDRASYITSAAGLIADLLTPANNTGDAIGDTYISIEGLEGSNFDDDLRGNNSNNFLIGGAGADVLNGRGGGDFAAYITAAAGLTASLANPGVNTGDAEGDSYINIEHLSGSNFADTLIGNAGNNFLQGRGGADMLDGGAGSNTADYFNSPIGLVADLGNTANNTGEAIGDVYVSIRQLRGSAFDDVLRGDALNNLLDGQAGADTLDGGAGFDYAWYNTNSTGTGVTASLADPGVNTGDAAGDVYVSIEGLIGSGVADTLIGNTRTNFLRGQGGGDHLDGRGDFDFADYFNATSGVTVDLANPEDNTGEATGDTYISIEGVRGGAFDDVLRGDDSLNGGTAVNHLIGGLGADTLDGRGGFDYADYRNSSTGLLVSLTDQEGNTGEAAGDVFISIEGLVGSDFGDTLIGDGATNFIAGGVGGDAIDGQGGIDYAAYMRATGAVTVSLADPGGMNAGEAVGDTYVSIEGIRGSDFDDTLIGDGGDNFLAGGGGGDALDGGDGNDTARYVLWTAHVGVVASLADPNANTGDAAGDTYVSIENLWGTSLNDTLIGDGNDNVLIGDAGNDVLIGNGGADTLDGGNGTDRASYITSASGLTVDLLATENNTGDAVGDAYIAIEGLEGSNFDDDLRGNNFNNFFIGSAGADILDGRGGFDFAAYGTATVGVTASLADPASNTGDAAGDSYVSIEGLAGSNLDDTLIGNAGNNFLRGQGGADTLIGGGGFDFADHFSATTGVTVDLSNADNNTGEAGGDTYISIEGIRGSAFDDILRGNNVLSGGTSVNHLIGGQGADILDGNGGYDYADYRNSTVGVLVSLTDPGSNTGEAAGDVFIDIEGIIGSDLADTLIGDEASNNLAGGQGGDTLDGQSGYDYAAYFRSTSGLTASLADTGANSGEAVGDTFLSIEGLIGSDFDDTLIGDSGDNVLVGGLGGDVLEGGEGSDTARYLIWTAQIGVVASLADPGANTGSAAGDSYISIENLWGTSFNDTLIGDENDNVLTGDAGNDVLVGGGGVDTLDGGNGNLDRASYITSAAGLTVDLLQTENNTGDAEGDIYFGIEGLEGSAFDDMLRGNNNNNFLIGSAGADILDGRAGNDFASYSTATAGLMASLTNPGVNTGDAEGDTYISIESLAGSAFDDTLIGDAGNNFLQGRGGADALDGGGEFDWADYVNATTGVTVDLADPSNNTGDGVGDTFTAIEGIRGSAFDDILRGNNVLNGGTALNIFRGGLGADILDGGGGSDYADYAESFIGLTVSLNDPGVNTGEAAGDVFISIEGIFGSNFDDVLIGDANTNRLSGGLGADVLDGGDGIDYAHYNRAPGGLTVSLADPGINTGEAFGDTYISIEGIIGSRFDDTLIGDAGDNVFVGTEGSDALDGGDGIDTADYTSWRATVGVSASLFDPNLNTGHAAGDTYVSIENLRGTNFNDTLIGDAGNNALMGNAGDDNLQGGDGADALDGGDGDDILDGGLGVDLVQGGLGDDQLYSHFGSGPDTLDGGAGVDHAFLHRSDIGLAIVLDLTDPETQQTLADGTVLSGIERVNIFSGTGNDTLIGGAISDELIGGGGNDIVDGSGGNDQIVKAWLFHGIDQLHGGEGIDTLGIYAAGGTALDIDLSSFDGDGLLPDGSQATGFELVAITGWALNDTIVGSALVDSIHASSGDDTVQGGVGNDSIDGSEGTDTAVFTGNRADYSVTDNLDGTYAVADTRPGSPDGTDTVTNIELFQFADATYTLAELLNENQAPTDIELDNATIEENATAGTLVGTLSATDPDAGDTQTFTLIDDAGGRFEIIGNEIVVASGADLDFEAAASHSVTVRVTDSAGLFYDETFTISVSDLNEAPTSLTLTGDTVDENAPAGTVVGTLAATDPDTGDTLTFVLTDDAGGLFELVGDEVRVATGVELDFETQSEHTIAVEVTDSGGLTRLETFTITVTDVNEAPDSLVVTGSEVEENALAGTVVATLDATDPDTGDTLNFSLADDANGRFEVVGNEIRVAPDADLDFEAAPTHDVVVEVTDSGGLTRTETVTITVINVDEAPSDILLTGGEVAEDAAPGTVVATLEAVDPDGPGNITFSLADDAGGLFEVVGNEIRLAEGAVLDHETQASYEVAVEAVDDSGLTRTETFTIAVLNANETPTDITVAGGTVEENAAAGTLVATLAAVDPDAVDTFTFEIVNDPSGFFEIVGNEVRVAAGAQLDFETQAEHTLTLRVTDASGAFYEEDLTIEVLNANEGPTDITVVGGTVQENAAVGTLVATLAAVDPEVGDTFTFEIVSDPSGFFEVVGNEIRVATGAQIDYETLTEHIVTVRVTDSSGEFYEEDLTLAVENVAPIIGGTNANNTLVGTSEEDQIFGLAGNDTLSGAAGDDHLFGEAGNDTMEGGAGVDTLIGGLHNDTYILNADDGDILIENAGEGTDTVRIGADYGSSSYTLLENFENLVLLGVADIDGFGNELDNAIMGNGGNNVIDGGLGADRMAGGGGNDVYDVDDASDSVVESSGGGSDEIRTALSVYSLAGLGNVENLTYIGSGDFTGTGNNAANVLAGGAGNDTLDGAGGADTLIGGSGDDIYIVNHTGDVVFELAGEGTSDTVRASLSHMLGTELENLVLTGTGRFTGMGNSLDNVLTGNTGANTLDGAGGADTLIGGAGNDIYIVDNVGDTVVELAGQGTDTVRSLLSNFGLEALTSVEHLTFIGTGDFEGRGNDLANTVTGGAGNDTLEGGASNDTLVGNDGNDSLDGGLGGDTMRGGIGDDAYFVDNALDRAIENNGQGVDTVTSSVDFTLRANVENLILTETADNGTGNGLANVITGNELINTLNGQAGDDVLIGGGGLDTLRGGSGDDLLVFDGPAFTKADGGTNQDTFVFGGDFDLDLSLISNSALTGLEAFDISGGAGIDNLLTIRIDDVRDLSSSANAALSGSGFGGPLSSNSVVVYGDAGDTVSLAAGTGSFAGGSWQDAGVATIGDDTYTVYNYLMGSTLYGSIAIDTDMFVV